MMRKRQIPSTKLQGNFKFQTPNSALVAGCKQMEGRPSWDSIINPRQIFA
jgi:hypothetical protein